MIVGTMRIAGRGEILKTERFDAELNAVDERDGLRPLQPSGCQWQRRYHPTEMST